jgi:uncharacterized alpha-E superfamily protein
MHPREILAFVLFDPHAPRSLCFGAAAVHACLDRLANGRPLTAPARIIGRLHAQLAYGDAPALTREDAVLPFLDGMLGELGKAHDALEALYFAT